MPQNRKDLKIAGTNLWYLVGLITSDGNLSKDGRHIDITSSDSEFLEHIKNSVGIANKIGVKYGYKKQRAFRIQIANRNFYEFLESIGLTQSKSLIVGEINVPSQYFVDFLRGLIDGDGCIRRWIHPSNNREQWSLRIYSGSEEFIKWLATAAGALLKIKGKIYRQSDNQWILKFGKMAAKEIAKKCYYKDCLGLDRKIKLANGCLGSYLGWNKSKTVLNLN